MFRPTRASVYRTEARTSECLRDDLKRDEKSGRSVWIVGAVQEVVDRGRPECSAGWPAPGNRCVNTNRFGARTARIRSNAQEDPAVGSPVEFRTWQEGDRDTRISPRPGLQGGRDGKGKAVPWPSARLVRLRYSGSSQADDTHRLSCRPGVRAELGSVLARFGPAGGRAAKGPLRFIDLLPPPPPLRRTVNP